MQRILGRRIMVRCWLAVLVLITASCHHRSNVPVWQSTIIMDSSNSATNAATAAGNVANSIDRNVADNVADNKNHANSATNESATTGGVSTDSNHNSAMSQNISSQSVAHTLPSQTKVSQIASKDSKDDTVTFVPPQFSEDGEVVVADGYMCVPEKSALAESLAQAMEESLSEDLSQAVKDEKASAIAPIEVVDHPEVDKWFKYFLKNRSLFQRYLDRGANFKTLVSQVLKEEGLPTELFYLALVESGFRPTARSTASAVGIWQFIRSTGKRYGLAVNYYIDERKDPVRSTRAAARFLASLYRVYQSWELAAAAYNAGENRVLSAIMRGHTRDYWELSSRKLLPRETRNYVPKIMAAIKIGQNLERYRFTFKAKNDYGIPVAASVPGGVRLRHVAAVAGVSETSLRSLNPHLKRHITPPGKAYKVWVSSKNHSQRLAHSYKKLSLKKQHVASSRSSGTSKGYHLVRRGQSLESISRRYGLTVNDLRNLNGVKGSLIYVGQKLKVSKESTPSGKIYVVKKGDTLYSIAKRYHTSVRVLQRKNRIKGSLVLIGQKLRI
ncbi:MAG: LysM peptidoglycan-binding domain-containing protein [Proteobacteria bacterium]|nr:LysM peptidoglycan-binding domain-containing protein [Pseudomonadota bacterium]